MVRVLVLVALAGCVKSDSVECSNGLTCPSDRICDEANGGCIVQAQIDACMNLAAFAPCAWPEGGGDCINGVCLAQRCGDGRRSGNERCDPTDETANMTTCTSVELGYYMGGDVACDEECRWDDSHCSEYCGDGILNGNEVCEEEIPPVEHCFDYGFDRGTLGCAACGVAFGNCALIGWTRRTLPARPSRVFVVGSEAFAAIDVAGPHLAARFIGGAWIGLGTFTAPEAPTANAIAATGASDVWVAGATNATTGDLGFVAHYDGTSWTRVRTFPAIATALWATSAHVFAIAGAELYIFDGTSWSQQTLTASTNGYWISGTSASDVWIGGGRLWHGGAAQTFAEVTLPVAGSVSGVHAFGTDQVAVAIHETTPNRLAVRVFENNTWRAAPWTVTGSRLGVPFARSGTDLYLLVIDPAVPSATQIAHHDGTLWTALTDASMKPTTLAGSADAIVAVDRNIDVAFHYQGAVWVAKAATSSSVGPVAQLAGTRPDEVFAPETSGGFLNLYLFNGTGWGNVFPARGVPDAVGDSLVYVIERNSFGNPRFWRRNNGVWTDHTLAADQTDRFAHWIGIHGPGDVFLKRNVGPAPPAPLGPPRYVHWAGSFVNNAPLAATNIPDGTELDHIDCRPGAGCYAGGGTTLWRTPGDRNAWGAIAAPDVGPLQALWVGDASFIALGGTLGRLAHGDGTTWTVTQLPTNASVVMLTGSSPTDAFAITKTSFDEHQLFHWNGSTWSRIRTPVPAIGSNVVQLWSSGRVTYFGGGTTDANRFFYALVRTEPW